jgi:hypothetical protein
MNRTEDDNMSGVKTITKQALHHLGLFIKKTKDEISKQNIRQRVRIIQNLEYVFSKS